MITGALSRFLALLLGLALALAGAEVLARLAVPAHEFWSMPDLFRAVDAPDVRYTLQPRLAENAFGVDLRTNAFGFRGQEWRMPKLAGRFRIALLGDSHGFGLGVPFPDTTGVKRASTSPPSSHPMMASRPAPC